MLKKQTKNGIDKNQTQTTDKKGEMVVERKECRRKEGRRLYVL